MKVKLKLIILGNLPFEFDINKIKNWKSNLFEIISQIDKHSINNNSDGSEWEFTDKNIEKQLPNNLDDNILIAITNVPLELNYFSRRLSKNRVCITFNGINEILKNENIPIENLILRLLYSYTLAYLSHGNSLPTNIKFSNFTHDETRGCLFDMNGIKKDIIYSTNKPIICPSCIENLKKHKVSENLIFNTQNEIKNINKKLYFRIIDFIKNYPIISFFSSAILAIFLGVIGSLIASIIIDFFKNN